MALFVAALAMACSSSDGGAETDAAGDEPGAPPAAAADDESEVPTDEAGYQLVQKFETNVQVTSTAFNEIAAHLEDERLRRGGVRHRRPVDQRQGQAGEQVDAAHVGRAARGHRQRSAGRRQRSGHHGRRAQARLPGPDVLRQVQEGREVGPLGHLEHPGRRRRPR